MARRGAQLLTARGISSSPCLARRIKQTGDGASIFLSLTSVPLSLWRNVKSGSTLAISVVWVCLEYVLDFAWSLSATSLIN